MGLTAVLKLHHIQAVNRLEAVLVQVVLAVALLDVVFDRTERRLFRRGKTGKGQRKNEQDGKENWFHDPSVDIQIGGEVPGDFAARSLPVVSMRTVATIVQNPGMKCLSSRHR